jgi:hypothetical protein
LFHTVSFRAQASAHDPFDKREYYAVMQDKHWEELEHVAHGEVQVLHEDEEVS